MVFRLPLRTRRHTEPPVLSLQHQTVLCHHWRWRLSLFCCHSSVGSTCGLGKFTVIHDQWCCCSSGGYSEAQQSCCEYSLYWPSHSCWGVLLCLIEMLE